ncbi:hypothetical protein G6F55_014245 [Rhizopus delemar]|nr:hypothetical protein G6F55_014245 [Rhizopus delemar]
MLAASASGAAIAAATPCSACSISSRPAVMVVASSVVVPKRRWVRAMVRATRAGSPAAADRQRRCGRPPAAGARANRNGHGRAANPVG